MSTRTGWHRRGLLRSWFERFAGTWDAIHKQLDAWAAVSLYSGNLALDEGFLLLDFGI